jgi:SAM-dependent methyltransferase
VPLKTPARPFPALTPPAPAEAAGGWESSAEAFAYASSELDALAEARNYYRWILRQFRPHLDGRVVEVGAGIGTFSALLASEPRIDRLTLCEPASDNFPRLKARFAGAPRVEVRNAYFEAVAEPASADAIVLVNVLEHIPSDADFLAAARRALAPGGALLLFVPAFPALFGSLDRAFGHHRRYTKRVLDERLRAAGLATSRLRYVNMPGTLPWLLAGKLLRRRTIGRSAVRFYDRWVLPWVFALEQRWEPPVAQSLLAVATKPEARR